MATCFYVVLCITIFFFSVYCNIIKSPADEKGYFYFQLENHTIIKEFLNDTRIKPKALGANDCTLHLYTRETGEENPCKLTTDSLGCSNWKNCGYDPRKCTIVIIHGYTNSYLSDSVQIIAKAYLIKKDCNIIVVDYYPISFPYLTVIWYSKDIGKYIARAFMYLHENCGQDLTIVDCIGFSIGAHLCGLFCAQLPHLCYRIVALDAAAPVIGLYGPDGKLGVEDCKYLIAVHTSVSVLGITYDFGDIDFYPNGGGYQWGCDSGQYIVGVCDHSASCTLWADSIMDEYKFRADCECLSADHALEKKCYNHNNNPYMGEITPRHHRGIFYVDTNRCYRARAVNDIVNGIAKAIELNLT